MSEKRKDKRGRILKTGETQDKKTGRYKYTYYEDGKQNLMKYADTESEPEKYLYSKTEVLAAQMSDRSGALYPILAVLNEANINIEYMYAFTGSGPEEAYVVIRVNDVKTAEELLNAHGIRTLSDESLKI